MDVSLYLNSSINTMSALSSQRPTDESINILLVEDNPGDVRLLQEAAKDADSFPSLHPVTTGEEALEFLTEQTEADSSSLPGLILLDLNLPRMDGWGVLEEIRNDEQLEMLPVLVLTSSNDTEDIQRCYDAKANAYLTKPDGHDKFVSLLNKVSEFWFKHTQLPPTSQ